MGDLAQIYSQRVAINATAIANGGGAFSSTSYYWSSSEGDGYDAAEVFFGNGSQADD